MLVVEIDRIDPEAAQGFFSDFLNVVRMTVEGAPFAAVGGGGFPTEFGGDSGFAVEWRERFADELLVNVGSVDFGGIEEGDATIDCGVEDGGHFFFVFGWTEAKAHAHAAE